MIFNKILEIATQKGISISKLERLSGLSKGAISKWKTASPTLENVRAVAKVLNCSVDDLLSQE